MNPGSAGNNGHYIHKIQYNRRERLVGFFLFSALVLLAALLFITSRSQHFFERQVQFYAHVKSSEGISQGSTVTLLGTDIGHVSNLEISHGRYIRLTLDVYKSHQELIRADAKVTVNRLISFGNALIEIRAGSVDAPVLEEGATLPVEETPSVNDLVWGIARIVKSVDSGLLANMAEIMPKLEQTVANADKIITQIASGQGTLGAAVFDLKVEQELKQVVQSGARILTKAQGIVNIAEQRLVELGPLISSADQVLIDVQGTTRGLPEMIAELKTTLVLTNSALTRVNEALRPLPDVALDAQRALVDVETVLDGAQNLWPLSTVIEQPDASPLISIHPLHD